MNNRSGQDPNPVNNRKVVNNTAVKDQTNTVSHKVLVKPDYIERN
jgi:hypothetical protein